MALAGNVVQRATEQHNLIFSWAAVQDRKNNISNVAWQLLLEAKAYGQLPASEEAAWSVTLAGNTESGTAQLRIGNSQTKALASGSMEIPHADDGTAGFDFAFSLEGLGVSAVTGEGQAVLDPIPRATVPQVHSGVLGSEIAIALPRASESFTHTLEYSFGKASGVIAQGVGELYRWTPPLALAEQIPNATEGVAVIFCTTFDGDAPIGQKQVSLTLAVPESVKPEVTFTLADSAFDTFGVYVQNVSRPEVQAQAVCPYGATLISQQVTLDGKPYNGILPNAGQVELAVSVTDSRGRKASKSVALEVAAYEAPQLTLTACRCTAEGKADDNAGWVDIRVTGHISPIGGINTGTLELMAGDRTECHPFDPETEALAFFGRADPDKTMPIRVTLTDKVTSVSKAVTLSTGFATLDILAGGKGIAFGKVAEKEGFECAMDAWFTGKVQGVAPAGFGLGESAWRSVVPDSAGGTGFFCMTENSENAPFQSIGDIIHIGRTDSIATQLGIEHQYGRPDLLIRKKSGGGWGDWRHINPRMIPGREYLTNEVWQDKDVYVKLLNFETLAASGNTRLPLGMGLTPVSIRGIAYNADYVCDLSAYNGVDEVYYQVSTGELVIHSAAAEAANYKAVVVVEYTKEGL